MAKYFLIYRAICLILLLSLSSGTHGAGSERTQENHNYPLVGEKLVGHNAADQIEEGAKTIVPKSSIEENENEHENENENNRIDDIQNNLLVKYGPLRSLNIIKRAPNGFIGMRGKKENEFNDNRNRDDPFDWDGDHGDLGNILDTDKDLYDFVGSASGGHRYKKAPTAFYGVRGKKYNGPDYGRVDGFLQKLEQERMRETMLQDFLDRLAANTMSQNEIEKRAPTGFTGMRGKRPADSALGLYEDELFEKRGPTNAFMGVRGKKDVGHQNFKRSPPEAFNRRNGKNQRFVDFSNKFVAVRGKKSFEPQTDLNTELLEQQAFMKPTQEKFYVNTNAGVLPWASMWQQRNKRATNSVAGKEGDVGALN